MRKEPEQRLYYDGLFEGSRQLNQDQKIIDSAITTALIGVGEIRANLIVPTKLILRNAYIRTIEELRREVLENPTAQFNQMMVESKILSILNQEAFKLNIHGSVETIINFISTNQLISIVCQQLISQIQEALPHNFRVNVEPVRDHSTLIPPHSYLRYLQGRTQGPADEAKAA